jgi:Domain of Unknown Function (DUF1540).
MGKLSCNATNCVNNVAGLCSADIISIKGKDAISSSETVCDTFKQKGIMNALVSMGNTNYVGEVEQMFSDFHEILMTPEVHCNAKKCIYNKHGICGADNLFIYGPRADSVQNTECETFNNKR